MEIDSKLRFESMNIGIAEVVVGSTPTQSIFYYKKTTALF